MFDPKRAKGHAFSLEQTLQEEHKKLEVFAFESETRITSLEEQITTALKEKAEVISINEDLTSELEELTEKLNTSTYELHNLKEEISAFKQSFEESDINQEKLKSSIKVLIEEKEELAMQLTDSLLEIEEERAIWSAKEKDALLSIEEQARSNNVHITSLSTELSEVRNELESCREECRTLQERLTISSEKSHLKENFSEKILELDQVEKHHETGNDESNQSREISKANCEMLSLEQEHLETENADEIQMELHLDKGDNLSSLRELNTTSEFLNEFQNLKNKLSVVTIERDKLMTLMEDQQKHVTEVEFMQKHCQDELSRAKVHVEELSRKISCMEVKIHADVVTNNKGMAKLRMRLRGTQAKLDAFRGRYKEAIDESVLLNRRYEEAAGKLKDQLSSKGIEVLNLKKQLAAAKGQ